MKLYKYIILSSVLMMACACVEETFDSVKPQVGSNVQFGLSLDKGVETRTIYGDETSTGFPIYWVEGDKVLIASPQCASGKNSAEYLVEMPTKMENGVAVPVENPNYAGDLTPTGESGVQWGNSEKADFYSIYPSVGSTLKVTGNTVSATLQVAPTQYAHTTEVGGVFYAQPKEMGNVMMYAYTPQASNGTIVDLKYKPFSTVIEFTVNAPKNAATAAEVGDITVQALTLTAPTGTNIAGKFNFNFPTSEGSAPTITIENTTVNNEIVLHFLENNAYKTVLTQGKSIKAKMCLTPTAGITSMAGWKVTVTTSAGTWTKTIADGSGINTALTPGMVHKIVLPTLKYGSKEWEYTLDNWIPTLPDYRNIYLTELSLPGAWYAGSPDGYQATTDIATLWKGGVRAFAVECRTISPYNLLGNKAPNNLCVSGTGRNHTNSGGSYVDDGSTTYISDVISNIIATLTTSNTTYPDKKEYAVLVLNYADGGENGQRDVDHKYFLNGIATILSNLTDTQKALIHSDKIDKNTTVDDVLGKLIIKVNVDKRTILDGFDGVMSTLMSYNPFYGQDGNTIGPYFSELYWSTWSDDYRTFGTSIGDFSWCFSSANRTQVNEGTVAGLPTYVARKEALTEMLSHSKEIYEASTHNVWFYFNAGGTLATATNQGTTDPNAYATEMNKWLLETIQANTDPSPLGIVMFNQCTSATYNGPAIIDEIIKMNSRFYLKHAGDGTEVTPTSEIQSLSSNYSSAVIDNGTDAMNWE